MTTDGGSQPLITREQSRIEGFGKRYIDRVIGREIVPQGPNAWQKEIMRVPADREIGKIGQRFGAALIGDFSDGGVAAKDLRHFDIKEMRRMQRLPWILEEACFHRLS